MSKLTVDSTTQTNTAATETETASTSTAKAEATAKPVAPPPKDKAETASSDGEIDTKDKRRSWSLSDATKAATEAGKKAAKQGGGDHRELRTDGTGDQFFEKAAEKVGVKPETTRLTRQAYRKAG